MESRAKDELQTEVMSTTAEVFELFKKIAKQPSIEMAPRFYMLNKDSLDRELQHKAKDMDENTFLYLDNRSCGFTVNVLSNAIFGNDTQSLIKYEFTPSTDQTIVENFWEAFNKNNSTLKSMSKNYFYAYFIDFSYTNFECSFVVNNSHGFAAIQHIDEDSNVSFSLLQSYVSRQKSYTLGDYLDQNKYNFTDENFTKLLKFTFSLMQFEKWTEQASSEYELYFGVKDFKAGQPNVFHKKESKFHISFGLATSQQVIKNAGEFEKFKLENPITQKFRASY